MTDTPSLFDIPAGGHARTDDPDTSRDAATAVEPRLNDQCRRVFAAILDIDHRNGGGAATAHEIAMRLAYTGHAPAQNIIARRCTDLRRAGLVVDSGERRLGGSGVRLIAWSPTTAGRKAAA